MALDVLVKSCKKSFDGKEKWNIVKELVANTEKKLLRALLVRQDFDSGATCLHYVTKSKDLELFQAVFHGNPEAFDISDNQKQSVLNYASNFSGKEINQWVEDNYLQNVALKKTATQSSTIDDDQSYFGEDFACVAYLAVDGNTVGRHDDPCTVSYTQLEYNPWWQVDLEDFFDIQMIRVYNRADTNFDQLKNFKVRVLQTFKDGHAKLVWESEEQIVAPRPFITLSPPRGTNGNVVRITRVHPEEGNLVLSEVQVWSVKTP